MPSPRSLGSYESRSYKCRVLVLALPLTIKHILSNFKFRWQKQDRIPLRRILAWQIIDSWKLILSLGEIPDANRPHLIRLNRFINDEISDKISILSPHAIRRRTLRRSVSTIGAAFTVFLSTLWRCPFRCPFGRSILYQFFYRGFTPHKSLGIGPDSCLRLESLTLLSALVSLGWNPKGDVFDTSETGDETSAIKDTVLPVMRGYNHII